MKPLASLLTPLLILFASGCGKEGSLGSPAGGQTATGGPLRVVVMDPLADQLACDCVKGYAQRQYPKLCQFLSKQLGRPVEYVHSENLTDAVDLAEGRVDLIIGKQSLVRFEAAESATPVRPIAMLTDKTGSADLTGLFVVRSSDLARSPADLKGKRIVFGAKDSDEKHAAALAAIRSAGLPLPTSMPTADSCNAGALAVADGKADATVISSYAMPLLEGCGTIERGSLKVIGQTAPVPFVTVFATPRISPHDEQRIITALLAVRNDRQLLVEMESRDGFVKMPAATTQPHAIPPVGWTDWRGPNRDGISQYVPERLPAKANFLWRHRLTGHSPSGVAATTRFVVVADKDAAKQNDIWRCLEADTGKQIWTLEYPADKDLDYSNSPRAMPVIYQGLVYVLGAMGDLYCVRLANGKVVWSMNLPIDFATDLAHWGTCSTPLIVDDMLIVNPGAEDASLVALDRLTGKVIWTSPGSAPAYGSLICMQVGTVRQIVGFDAASLGGWDVQTGKRLWEVVPENDGDFNVPTPLDIGGRLFVATENNGARLFAFDATGKVKFPPKKNEDLTPDMTSPVVVNGLIFGYYYGRLMCLDAGDLTTRWTARDGAFDDYASLIAGNGNVLISTTPGELILARASAEKFEVVSRLKVLDHKADVWSHPALVGNRLYLRSQNEVVCLLLDRSN